MDATGDRFEEEVVLDSLSSCGLYLRLRHPISEGARLFIYVKLWLGEDADVRGPRIALYGDVIHSEGQPDGRCGIAVAFDRHRFLYAPGS